MQTEIRTYKGAEKCLKNIHYREYLLLEIMWRCHRLYGHEWFDFYSEDIVIIIGNTKHRAPHFYINRKFKNVLEAVKVEDRHVRIRWHKKIMDSPLEEIRIPVEDDLTRIMNQYLRLQLPLYTAETPRRDTATRDLIKYINKWNVGPVDQ